MKLMRQGDVILQQIDEDIDTQNERVREHSDLVLAEGEVTGHAHRITEGEAELYELGNRLYLRVHSDAAMLTHEEHRAIAIPKGDWIVRIQREYEPGSWRSVAD
ncbi:MAG: hypothetical protein ACP5D7_03075 [Limnospira sp.]